MDMDTRLIMTFDANEAFCWLFALSVALSVVASILWFIMQAIALYEGHKPHLINYWRNLKEIRRLFLSQDNLIRRRRYMFIMHLFDGCRWAAVVCIVVSLVLLFVGVLK